MLKKLFGPFPDEPLLYSFDKILGLFHKIDSKLKRINVSNNGGTNESGIVTPILEEIVDVIVETTTENVVTSTTSTQGVNFLLVLFKLLNLFCLLRTTRAWKNWKLIVALLPNALTKTIRNWFRMKWSK